ncbi:C1orf21 isoform 3 [Pan troglodytes]|uniref:C1orf21 isoform 3 n=1 Tax=Pan troglodytes TaxID=9598 RepID=A0A2J8N6E6_PANTR|nr:C1orf21 isoform 3 [Pan troglodytes]
MTSKPGLKGLKEQNLSQSKLEKEQLDEYRIKPVEEVKYMKNGAEEEQKIAARNQENLEKSASSNVRLKTNKEVPGLVHQPRANMHISESQQEFFRMLDEKIEKGRDYCSEEEDIT